MPYPTVTAAVTLTQLKRTQIHASNAGAITILATTTALTTVDLGTVAVGDEILVNATLTATKGALLGGIDAVLAKSSGTGAVVAFNGMANIVSSRYSVATTVGTAAVSGSFRVTTAGTLVLSMTATSAGSDSTVAIGGAQFTALVLCGV